MGHAPKVTAKAIISISGEASARMLSSQSMCASLRMERNECLHRECVIDTWIGVNLREERWSLWKRNKSRAREVHTDNRCPALSLRHLCSRSTCALRWSLGRSLRSPYKQHPRTTFINSMGLFGPSSYLQESAEGIQARGVHGNTNYISDVGHNIYRRGPCSTWTEEQPKAGRRGRCRITIQLL